MAHVETFGQFMDWKLDPERPYQYHVDTSIELASIKAVLSAVNRAM